MEIIDTTNSEPEYALGEGSVAVTVYPRVHMFTFDLSLISGILRHGSMGCSLKNMPITITAERSSLSRQDEIIATNQLRLSDLDFQVDFDKLRSYIGLQDYYRVKVDISFYARAHSGLGLSTQILGAIYLACAKLSGKPLHKEDLFMLGLGHYSALGLSLLFTPGLIFEMGVKEGAADKGLVIEPALSTRHETVSNTVIKVNNFPFYMIVAVPRREASISGEYEISFWNKSLPETHADAYKNVYNIFENIIPSIIERDFNVFIQNLRENIKRGSKRFEERVQSNKTKQALRRLRKTFGFAAVSSLGPTLYAFSKDDPSEAIRDIEIDDYLIFVYGPDGSVRRKINAGDSLLIASFACLGKTTFANRYPHLAVDIESIHYERDYDFKDENDEVAKGDGNWTPNPKYPDNYVNDVVHNIGKSKVIFLTTAADALGELNKLGVRYDVLYPGKGRKEQVLSDARKRGNSDNFVAFLEALLATDSHRKSFENLEYDKFVIVEDDKYIEDYIAENYIL